MSFHFDCRKSLKERLRKRRKIKEILLLEFPADESDRTCKVTHFQPLQFSKNVRLADSRVILRK